MEVSGWPGRRAGQGGARGWDHHHLQGPRRLLPVAPDRHGRTSPGHQVRGHRASATTSPQRRKAASRPAPGPAKESPSWAFNPDGIVKREVFERLYGHHLDPRDPAGQTRLGRAPSQFRSAEDIYAALLAAEPEATAERRAQLLIEAKAQVRTPGPVLGRHVQRVEVHLPVPRQRPGQRGCGSPARGPGERGSLAAGRRRHLGRDHGRQRGGPGLPAARGRADPRRLPPGRPVGGRPRMGDRLVPPAHQPRRRPAASRAQPDPAQSAPRIRRPMAGPGLHVPVPAPPGRLRDRRPGHRERPHPPVRRPVGPAQGRPRPGDRRRRAGADGYLLLPAAKHQSAHRAPGAGV